MDVKIKSYQMCFPKLNKKEYKKHPVFYQMAIIAIRLDELQEKSAYMSRCGRPSFGGTCITFSIVKDSEEYKRELEKIMEDGARIGLEFEKVTE